MLANLRDLWQGAAPVIGWVLWCLVAGFSVIVLIRGNRDSTCPWSFSLLYFLGAGAALVLTAGFGVSKFHLLWLWPAIFMGASLLSMMILNTQRGCGAKTMLHGLISFVLACLLLSLLVLGAVRAERVIHRWTSRTERAALEQLSAARVHAERMLPILREIEAIRAKVLSEAASSLDKQPDADFRFHAPTLIVWARAQETNWEDTLHVRNRKEEKACNFLQNHLKEGETAYICKNNGFFDSLNYRVDGPVYHEFLIVPPRPLEYSIMPGSEAFDSFSSDELRSVLVLQRSHSQVGVYESIKGPGTLMKAYETHMSAAVVSWPDGTVLAKRTVITQPSSVVTWGPGAQGAPNGDPEAERLISKWLESHSANTHLFGSLRKNVLQPYNW